MFIGREKELTLLQQDYIGKAVMVYGKRRVGKTTLIQKALENCQHQTVYYECSKGAMQDNIDGLVRELVRVKMLPVPLNFSTLQDVFIYLNALPKKIVVVIDEYPYLKKATDSATVDSIFQNIIDNRLSNIELVLSGSHIGMMKDLLQERNALYGRFAVTIKLNELNYLDAARFYPDRTPYDKVAHYAVFGGSPFVNQALNPAATLRENVISTILNPVSAVYLYASQLLLSDYSVKINAERIFSVIGNGKKRYTEIEDKLDVKKTGNPAVEISYMTGEHQTWLKEEMEMCDATPSLVQSRTLKDMSRNGTLTENYLHTLLTEEKPNQRQKFFLNQSDVQQYFPSNYTPQQMQNVIISLLRNWEHKRSSRQRPQREDELER